MSLIRELPLRDGTNLTIEDLEKQSSGSRFKQLKAAELIGNIRKAGSNSQALYMQLSGMTDKLASARYARFINKRFSELGANSSKNPGRISRSGSRLEFRRTKRQTQKRR